MNKINLTGLRADLPIGAMAAFGVLRICSRHIASYTPRLAWSNLGSGFHAVLQTTESFSFEDLTNVLLENLKETTSQPALTWSEQLKSVKIEDFTNEARKAAQKSSAKNRESADWFASFGSELITTDDGKLKTTPFDMSVARQKFPSDAIRLGASLASDEKFREHVHEALMGPWKYADNQHSFGWDPTTVKMGAFTHKAPTGMVNAGVSAAVWLAFQSLPLFPCFYSRGLTTRSLKRGLARTHWQPTLCWPVWDGAIDLSELKSLMQWAGIVDEDMSCEETGGRGVLAIYKSVRFKPNKYLASFRPPELVYAAAPGAR